jgi:chromosomal replication initiator protein
MLSSNASNEMPDSLARKAWAGCVAQLRSELDTQIFSAYIEPVLFGGLKDGGNTLILNAPNRFICTQLTNNFRARVLDALRTELGETISVEFCVELPPAGSTTLSSGLRHDGKAGGRLDQGTIRHVVSSATLGSAPGIGYGAPGNPVQNQLAGSGTPSINSQRNSPPLTSVGQQSSNEDTFSDPNDISSNNLNGKYSFNTFVVGSSNQFCHAAAMRVAESPGQSYNPLFIYGGVGLGKTHLLHSIGNEVLRRNPRASILYVSSEAFTNELILALRNAKMDEFKRRMRSIEVLLIDDIQFICGKERTQEEFFHTFNALYSAKRQIVLTSDKIPSEIPGIEERLQTRFSWGLMADLQAPDFETRVAILKRKAALENFFLPEDVAHFVAEKVSSNVRELEGALTRLNALSSLQNVPITMRSASATLTPLLQPKTVNVTIDDIKKAVATHFGIKVSEIISKRRTKNLSFPRHIAMYLCRKHTTSSYPEIGGQFGGRDHSSVIHAASVVSSKVSSDQKVRETVEEIERRLATG